MIGKAKSIQHGANAIDYAINKKEAEIIDKRFIVGENGKEIKAEFKIFQNLNNRCKANDISFVISPDKKDGQKLTNKEFKEISEEFLKKMKLDKHQAIIVKHNDKEHTHLHLFVNRIDSNGKAYKDNFISKESQTKADEIAIKRNLTRAKVVQEFNKEMTKDIRNQIFEKHKVVLQHKPKNFQEYKDLMQSSGVKVLPTINKANKLQGFRIEYQGLELKASEVNRSMTLSKMGVAKGQTNELNPTLKTGLQRERKQYKGFSR